MLIVFDTINIEQQQYGDINGCCFLVVFVETLVMVLFEVNHNIRIAIFINNDMICDVIRIAKNGVSLAQIFGTDDLLVFICCDDNWFIKRETP